MTDTITKVRNYQGTNSFVIKMKQSLTQWGRLTEKQIIAVEKALMSTPKIDVNEVDESLKPIVNYEGENGFVKDIKSKLLKYGTLSDKQIQVALSQIRSENDKKNTKNLNLKIVGETILVGRRIGQNLKETYGLEFNPTLLDITKVLSVSPRAFKFEGKMTEKRSKVCRVCAKTLTDELSMLSGVGKTCSKHVGIPYLTDKNQVEEYREAYLKRIEKIGRFEFWIPKSQIKIWNGGGEVLMKMF